MRPLPFVSVLLAGVASLGATETPPLLIKPPIPAVGTDSGLPGAAPADAQALAEKKRLEGERINAFLAKLPGRWSGIQHMANPKKEVMRIRVSESYRWGEPVDGIRPLLSEMTYTIGTGAAERTFRGVSKTWVDKSGYGFSEVTQDGKTLRYHAAMNEDNLVFIPFSERGVAKSGNSLRFETKDGVESLIIIGFQTGADGLYRIAGKLDRVPEPAATK